MIGFIIIFDYLLYSLFPRLGDVFFLFIFLKRLEKSHRQDRADMGAGGRAGARRAVSADR